MIHTDEEHAKDLEELAQVWRLQEMQWLSDEQASSAMGMGPASLGSLRVLSLWWD